MLRFHLINDIEPALAADNLVVWTDFFNACTHFHADHCLSCCGNDTLLKLLTSWLSRLAVRNPTLRKIVRCQLYGNAVARYDPDEMLPHLTRDVSYNLMAVLEFDSKLSARKGLNYRTRKLNDFFTPGHKYNSG